MVQKRPYILVYYIYVGVREITMKVDLDKITYFSI